MAEEHRNKLHFISRCRALKKGRPKCHLVTKLNLIGIVVTTRAAISSLYCTSMYSQWKLLWELSNFELLMVKWLQYLTKSVLMCMYIMYKTTFVSDAQFQYYS